MKREREREALGEINTLFVLKKVVKQGEELAKRSFLATFLFHGGVNPEKNWGRYKKGKKTHCWTPTAPDRIKRLFGHQGVFNHSSTSLLRRLKRLPMMVQQSVVSHLRYGLLVSSFGFLRFFPRRAQFVFWVWEIEKTHSLLVELQLCKKKEFD